MEEIGLRLYPGELSNSLSFVYCFDCGTIQGSFPLPVTEPEKYPICSECSGVGHGRIHGHIGLMTMYEMCKKCQGLGLEK